MFRKITSNRDPKDTLASEIKKEFKPYFRSVRAKFQRIAHNYPRFLFAMMVINIILSVVLTTTVLRRHPAPAKKVVVTTPSGFDNILIAGEKLKKTMALKRTIDSLSLIKNLSQRDSVLLDSALDQFQKLNR
jgi:hypothetical protein